MQYKNLPIVLAVLCMALASAVVQAAEPALWLRNPAISPDGGNVVFSHRGDLWSVPVEGGLATQLTVHAAHDTKPVWSPDGTSIAFASNRYGNYDVFVMPSGGGRATRLTYHSASDNPTSFTPDGESVLFSSGRLDSASCVQYPRRGAQPELYRVSLKGGMPKQVLTTPAMYAVWNSAGTELAYSDEKGLETDFRKHDNSSFARDVWIYEVSTGQHRRLTDFGYDDRQPVWAPGDSALFYLSESSGTFNVWRIDVGAGVPKQITNHETHPVRFLSASRAGDLCYTWDGEIWVRPATAKGSHKLDILIAADDRHSEVEWTDVSRNISEIELSPDGKEMAFVARGEVFVTSVDHKVTRRITSTPEQERSVSFSPDGRTLLYAGERGGSWNLYRSDLKDEDEPSFFNATAIEEKAVLVSESETFQPSFSPDGKEVAYLEERVELKVLNLESGEHRTILPASSNYSYSDGDQWYQWSPDGQWFVVEYLSPTRWSAEVGLVPTSGKGEIFNLTKSGYEDVLPRWHKDGEVVYWLTDRHGERQQAGLPAQFDVYAAFLTTDAWDAYQLSEVELEQKKARDEKAEKEKKDEESGDEDAEDEAEDDEEIELPDPVELELDGLDDRIVRLSLHSAELSDALLTPDGEKLLYLAEFEKGYDLWVYEPRKKEVKLLAKLKAKRAGDLLVDKEGKKAWVLADRRIKAIDLGDGSVKPVKLEAKMRLEPAAERAYLFEHAWRQTAKKFYTKDLHGVDWQLYKDAYARFLPHIDNNHDFAELLSELQGELNASHLGCYHRPTSPSDDATATLAFFPDPNHAGAGIKILEIMDGGPFSNTDTRVEDGVIIETIDGVTIDAGMNWYPLLNHKAGIVTRLALHDPVSDERWQETVKPISQREESELLYQRWMRSRRAEVEGLSGGRLGYAHIRTMSDGRYREIFEEIFGRAVDKEAIVLDTRFNNGGNLVEALTIFLTGEVYARAYPRGQEIGVEPSYRWTKPSIVVMNEGNYSDAHCFPAAYTALGIGAMVGMPVPGTCTAVWWETLQDSSLFFGIPQVGYIDNEGDILENKHLPPDHLIDNDPALEAAGRDEQLEKAVEVLLSQLN